MHCVICIICNAPCWSHLCYSVFASEDILRPVDHITLEIPPIPKVYPLDGSPRPKVICGFKLHIAHCALFMGDFLWAMSRVKGHHRDIQGLDSNPDHGSFENKISGFGKAHKHTMFSKT